MQAIVSTIRDVMQYNTLFAQQLGLTANPSRNVVDNPVYLCDLVGSLVSADPSDLQNLMDEEVVSFLGFSLYWILCTDLYLEI